MDLWKNYHLAINTSDAIQALASAPGPARWIAGGTDLLLDLQQGRHPPVDTLVDVTAIPEMKLLEVQQDRLYVGAATPLNRIVAADLVRQHAFALIEACGLIGGPQVRNTATLGGNVAHALPAADGSIALLALDAQALVASREGQRCVPIIELYLGPGRSSLQAGQELLVGFYLPLSRPGQASAFRRVMRPQGVALPILNAAVWLQRKGDSLEDVRIAMGPAGPTPHRCTAAEDALRGRVYDPAALASAQAAVLETAVFRTSPHRATAEYRRRLSASLLADTLAAAWQRAAAP